MARIATPFGPKTTAAEVARGIDLSGRAVVVTGASSGIGVETARAMALTGARVTLAVRNDALGSKVAHEIAAATGNRNVRAAPLDLSDLDSIREFSRAWEGQLHVLVCNAGVMALPLQRTARGWEMQFATNHLGHFALASFLHGALAADGNARIVSVSSSAHLLSALDFADIHFTRRPYDPLLAYGQSKTANILFAVGVTERWRRDGITANALMPGAVATNLQRFNGGIRTPPERRKTPEQGAATTVLLATSPLLEGVGGRYFEDCNEAKPLDEETETMRGVAAYALDGRNADRLWDESERLTA